MNKIIKNNSNIICPFLTEYYGEEGQKVDFIELLEKVNELNSQFSREIDFQFMQEAKFQNVTLLSIYCILGGDMLAEKWN